MRRKKKNLEVMNASIQLQLVDFHIFDVNSFVLGKLQIIEDLRGLHGIHEQVLFRSTAIHSFIRLSNDVMKENPKSKSVKRNERERSGVPDHGHLERGVEGELGEEERVVVEFGTEFGVQELLPKG